MIGGQGRSTTDSGPRTIVKLEFNGRLVRFRLEIFPLELKWRRRPGPSAPALAARRRLLRALNQQFQQTQGWLEKT